MAIPVLGTAHLFGIVAPQESERLLRAALDAGFRAFDTAPSYGHGRSEDAVGRLARDHDIDVTTKVGIAALPAPSHAMRFAKALARRAPRVVQQKVRGDPQRRPAEQGRFGSREIRDSIDASLRRLHRIDRLLLHEVRPDDLTDALLADLERFLRAGDVGQLGVATANARTGQCLDRAPELLTAANVSIAPTARQITRDTSLTRVVGHGVFGASGADLRRAQARLHTDPAAAATWRDASAGTRCDVPSGLADAFVLRAVTVAAPDGVIVATGRADRLTRMRELIDDGGRLPASLVAALDSLCDESGHVRPV